ncbi:MAG: glycoside hydrolase family 5 protein [Oscillospiraceae bacterium]
MLRKIFALLAALSLLISELPERVTGFWHTEGSSIVSPLGETAVLCGMGFGNDVWESSLADVGLHHNEDSFRELSELSFNSVRFLLNYRWFEDDSEPYSYKQEGFDYIDKSIALAKKYGIGLVLNMHYPQGGYQSQGSGTALWTDQENQSRLSALWGEIARRYADEPEIIGYGIVNEPVVPEKATLEETVGQCRSLVQRCTDEIRRCDSRHMIFAERVAAVQDIATGEMLWEKYTAEKLWYLIDDPNVVYESHFYEPSDFTHQNADAPAEYPSDQPYADYINYWVGCQPAQTEGSGYYETDFFQRTDEYNLFSPVLHTWGVGQGEVWFDDVVVTEYSADGGSQVVWEEDFSGGGDFAGEWSSDGSGSYRLGGGFCTVSGANADYVLTLRSFELKEGCRYKVSGHISGNIPAGCTADIRADFALAENIYTGRELIFSRLSEITDFSEKNNVPVYLGEFGADAESFKEDRGGEHWVEDVLDYCTENGLSFSYHAYHEPMFGFYPEDTSSLPQHCNEELARLFADKLR